MVVGKIFQKISSLINSNFLRVSGANGFVTILKSFLSIFANKVVANIIGTSGIAMIGQLQNFIGITSLISNGGFNNGLTKYIAEKKDKKTQLEFIGTAFFVSTVLSSVLGIIIVIFSKSISIFIFSNPSYYSIIILFALTLFAYNLNTLILSIVNGFQYYRQYFKINITTTFVSFIMTLSLVYLFKEYGALFAIVLSQSIVCLFAYFYIKNDYWIKAFSFNYFRKDKLLLLLNYSSITIFAAIIWPIVDMIIRTYVIKYISIQEAGLWQATRNINDYIVNIAVGSFSIYLLPKLSSIESKVKLKHELFHIYKIIIPITLISFFIFFLIRDFAVQILYSKSFYKVGQYLLLQMIGSFFWMCRIPLMNYMLAKRQTKTYLITELIFASLYIVLVVILIPVFKIQGIQMSFAVYNFIYLIVMAFIVKKLTDVK